VDNMMSESVHAFLKGLLDPGRFGHAVTAEVRDEARVLLCKKKVETVKVGFAIEEE
jgi:hypothetical protein